MSDQSNHYSMATQWILAHPTLKLSPWPTSKSFMAFIESHDKF